MWSCLCLRSTRWFVVRVLCGCRERGGPKWKGRVAWSCGCGRFLLCARVCARPAGSDSRARRRGPHVCVLALVVAHILSILCVTNVFLRICVFVCMYMS